MDGSATAAAYGIRAVASARDPSSITLRGRVKTAEPGDRGGRRHLRARRGADGTAPGSRRIRVPRALSSAAPAGTIREGSRLPLLGFGRATTLGDVDALVVDVAEHGDELGRVVDAAARTRARVRPPRARRGRPRGGARARRPRDPAALRRGGRRRAASSRSGFSSCLPDVPAGKLAIAELAGASRDDVARARAGGRRRGDRLGSDIGSLVGDTLPGRLTGRSPSRRSSSSPPCSDSSASATGCRSRPQPRRGEHRPARVADGTRPPRSGLVRLSVAPDGAARAVQAFVRRAVVRGRARRGRRCSGSAASPRRGGSGGAPTAPAQRSSARRPSPSRRRTSRTRAMAVTDVLLTLAVTCALALASPGGSSGPGSRSDSRRRRSIRARSPPFPSSSRVGELAGARRAAALAVAGFALTSPFVLIHAGAAWDDVSRVQRLARAGWLGFEHDPITPLAYARPALGSDRAAARARRDRASSLRSCAAAAPTSCCSRSSASTG